MYTHHNEKMNDSTSRAIAPSSGTTGGMEKLNYNPVHFVSDLGHAECSSSVALPLLSGCRYARGHIADQSSIVAQQGRVEGTLVAVERSRRRRNDAKAVWSKTWETTGHPLPARERNVDGGACFFGPVASLAYAS